MFLSSLSSVSVSGAAECAQSREIGTAQMSEGAAMSWYLTLAAPRKPRIAVGSGCWPDEVISTSGTWTPVHFTDHSPRPLLDRLHCLTPVKYVNTF
jgi:hypothetical protein